MFNLTKGEKGEVIQDFLNKVEDQFEIDNPVLESDSLRGEYFFTLMEMFNKIYK